MSRRWVGVGEMKSSIGGRGDRGNATHPLICGRVVSRRGFERALKIRVQRRGGILFRGSIVGSLEQRSVKLRTEPSQVTEEPHSRPEIGLALVCVAEAGLADHVSVTR